MFGVRVFGMAVVMIVMMVVVMRMTMCVIIMIVVMMMPVIVIRLLQTTQPRAKMITKFTIGHVRPRRRGPLAFDVMMVAFLNRANFGFEPQNLRPVFTHHTGRWRHITERRMALAVGFQLGALFGSDRLGFLPLNGQNLRAVSADAAIGDGHIALLFQNAFRECF